jgi:hypothetical protein
MSEFGSDIPSDALIWKEPSQAQKPKVVEQREKDPQVDLVIDQPEIRSYTSIEYQISQSEGHELKPDRRIVFVVPPEFQGRLVRDVILRHRKGEKYRVDITPDRYDPHGAYSRVEVHDLPSGQWVGWQDPKGYSADKFAESRPSSDPENEVLHDWIAVGEIKPDQVRVTNVGQHPEYSVAQIHGLEIVFYPELEGVSYGERIYTPGTQFIDLEKGRKLPSYGGGSFNEGVYHQAIALNHSGHALYELGKDPGPETKVEDHQLTIKLQKGQSLVQVEVAIGDTENLDHISPKTKRKTRLGFAKLWIGIKKALTGQIDWFVKNANVPPQGVIAGGPIPEKSVVEEGDELVIESRDDASFVMGWRLAYKENK